MHTTDCFGKTLKMVERAYPDPAQGWVDGAHLRREAHLATRPVRFGAEGITLVARRFAEESEPLNGVADSIARDTYYEGSFVRMPIEERDWHLAFEVAGAERGQRLALVVNGEERARFDLAARAVRRLEVTVPLTSRILELGFVPADDLPGTEMSEKAAVVLRALEATAVEREPAPSPRILIAGDSTVQTYFDEERPQSGWGEWLAWHLYRDHAATVANDPSSDAKQARVFTGTGPTVFNRSLGGRGFRTYLSEHRFDRLLGVMRPKDIVLIQFGLNDTSKERPQRYIPLASYAGWIDRYVASVVDRGATPVLITPQPQYRAPGREDGRSVFDDYADVLRSYAREHDVALIDLRAEAAAYLAEVPAENRSAYYLQADPFQYPSHPDGVRDNVHLSCLGAFVCAGIVARRLAELMPGLDVEIEPQAEPVPVRGLTATSVRGNVGLETDLRWEPQGPDAYYVVKKLNAATGRVYRRAVSVQSRYLDLPLPGQARDVVYTVTAWVAGHHADPVRIPCALPPDDDIVCDLS